jgi:hypothetical protein
MADRPPTGSTGPRIRGAQSGVRGAPPARPPRSQHNTGHQKHHRHYEVDLRQQPSSSRNRRASGEAAAPPPPPPPPHRRVPRGHKERTKTPAAARTWLAAAFALCIAVLKHRSRRGPAALQDAILLERDREYGGGPAQARLSVEIFTAPKPFRGDDAVHQTRAIESWLMLEPRPAVTLLGSGAGYAEVVKRYGLRWRPEIDTSFLGVPLFNAIVDAANASTAQVAVIANADIMIFDDFSLAVRKVHRDVASPWMMVGARWDVPHMPDNLLQTRGPLGRHPEHERQDMVRFARDSGTLHTYGGIDVWAWNTRAGVALFDGTMPHFVFGRGKYDNWLTHEVIDAGHRSVIDVSEACTFVHILHDHHLVAETGTGATDGERVADGAAGGEVARGGGGTEGKRAFWNQGARVKFELYINTYLAAAHGSYANQMGTILHTPFKLHSCYEAEGLCLVQRRRPNTCRCEYSPFVPQAQNDPFAVNDSRLVFCGLLSSESQVQTSSDSDTLYRFVVSGRPRAYASGVSAPRAPAKQGGNAARLAAGPSSLHGALLEIAAGDVSTAGSGGAGGAFGLPLLLDRLVEVIEHRTGSRRIVLTVLNSHHKSLLPRFACGARRAGVFESLVIAALDDETYHHAITRGLAVYLEESVYADADEEALAIGARFDSTGFPIVLSLRARIARRMTSLGREVFYADPDVVLARSPFESIPEDADIALLRGAAGTAPAAPQRHGGKGQAEAARRLSAAMFYARPGTVADAVLERLARPDAWRRPGAVEEAVAGARYAVLNADEYRDVVGSMPAAAQRANAVALHIGARGEAQHKLAVLAGAPDLDVYDDLAEVCRPAPTRAPGWL